MRLTHPLGSKTLSGTPTPLGFIPRKLLKRPHYAYAIRTRSLGTVSRDPILRIFVSALVGSFREASLYLHIYIVAYALLTCCKIMWLSVVHLG